MPLDGQLTSGAARKRLIDAVTARVWKDLQFRELLFSDSDRALAEMFGEVPGELRGMTFKPQRVDRFRARPNSSGGRDITVRPRSGDQPVTAYTRTVRGLPELVLVLYTKRCRYQCTFCRLPEASALSMVEAADIAHQVDVGFDLVARHQFAIRQISVGNEGSPLDATTLPADQLEMVLRLCAGHTGVRSIVVETRAEFVTDEILDRVQKWIAPCGLTLKIGLESANDEIRQEILRKRMDLEMFEQAVRLMGRRGIQLSSYVLLKASPWHDDAQGRADAIATCDYLARLCREAKVGLDLRVNAMYRARGSRWSDWAVSAGWTPPSIFDLADVLLQAAQPGVVVYAGLSEEGLATPDGHYEARPDHLPWARELLERYNETGDLELLRQVATFRARVSAVGPAPS